MSLFNALAALAMISASALELHVAPQGSDTNPGSLAASFATLEGARDALRAQKVATGLPEGGATVYLHEGVYFRSGSFTLGAEDSGAENAPITYRNVEKETPSLIGGIALPSDSFVAVDDPAARDRLEESARGQVLSVDLRALGVENLGAYPDAFRDPPLVPELFFDGQRMTLARWPNGEWAEVAKVIESGPAPWRDHKSDQPGTLEYAGDRPARWINAPAIWLHGYWCFDWCSETIKVKSIDPAAHQITFVQPHCYGLGSGNPAARRFYAVNLLEELDQPGEYYLDRAGAKLYFWPPQPLAGQRIILSTLISPIIDISDASYLTFQGLTLECCAGAGIQMKGGAQNRIAACCVRNTGQDGIIIDGGEKHSVLACDIYDTGTGGLRVGGGDRSTLKPCGHEALNNHIYRVSRRKRTHAYQVHLSGVGVRLAHNLLHDAPHQVIGLAGNDHLIEYNEIHHTGMETDDCGAFYMGRNPSERGSIIRYNYWHDIGSTFTHGSCAVYFDDGSGGQYVFGNVFLRAAGGSFGAVFVHGGHDTIVDNNIFIECKRAIRQVPWDDKRWEDMLKGDLWQDHLLKSVDITQPPYIERYPDLKDYFVPGARPRVNRAERNVAVRCGEFVEGNWKTNDNLITEADPGFVDQETLNFQLRPDSEVFSKVPGFQAIPFNEIGLYRDALRPELPLEKP